MSTNRRRRLSFMRALGLCTLILLAGIKESLSTYSTTTVTTTVSPANLLPYFDFDVPRNLTVTVGQTGFLHCRVERLGDKDVSWIRKRDLHILTAGSTTYTSDQRFQVIRPENSGNWTLQIKYPQPRDSGIYECQINTEPKMSLSYTFNVIELRANIVGPLDLYVKTGSDINLTCRILQGPHELGNIFWYKGTEIIDMTTNQNELDGGARISLENDWSDGLTSRLKIRRAMPSDTGNYTCVPTIAKTASVSVHVISGEHPAAMQRNSSCSNANNFYATICCLLFTIFTCCLQHLFLPTTTTRTSSRVANAGAATKTIFATSTNVTTTISRIQQKALRIHMTKAKATTLLPSSTIQSLLSSSSSSAEIVVRAATKTTTTQISSLNATTGALSSPLFAANATAPQCNEIANITR